MRRIEYLLETLGDLRHGIRQLRRRPVFAVTMILTLAAAIGANTAIFSVVRAVLLQPLPYEEPDRLMRVWGYHPEIGTETASYPDFVDWREQTTRFEDLVAVSGASFNMVGDGEPVRLRGSRVSEGFFRLLRSPIPRGRNFLPEEDRPGAEKVVILSDGLWRDLFGADPAVLGGSLQLDSTSYTVVGIAAPDFRFPTSTTQLWTPLALDVRQTGRRSDFLHVFGRLAPGATRAEAQAEMDTLTRQLQQAYPESNANWGSLIVPLHQEVVEEVGPPLLILQVAVVLVLLIACANVASLLLARAIERHREMAVRAALGAGRWRLVRQALAESMVIALLGGTAGLLAAFWGIDLLLAIAPDGVPRLDGVGVDGGVLVFTLALSLVAGVLFGMAPALRTGAKVAQSSLSERGQGGSSFTRTRARNALVVAEIALSLVLLIAAGLTIRSFDQMLDVDPGFRLERLLTVRLSLPEARYADDTQVAGFYDRLLTRIGNVPGVASVAMASSVPLAGGGPWWSIAIDGRPDPAVGTVQDANFRMVDGGYFRALGIGLVRGRSLTQRDRAEAPLAVVINETLARRYWPDADPIGERLAFDGTDDGPNWREIVGVVSDVRHGGLDQEEVRAIYVPHAQLPRRTMSLLIRAIGEPLDLVAAVRSQVAAEDPHQPIYAVSTMADRLGESLAPRRFAMLLLIVFAAVALIMAAVGLSGVISYSVMQRSQEMGLRMALGAQNRDILRIVVGHGLGLTLVGVTLGLAGAFLVTRWMSSLLVNVSPTDPVTFVALPALVTVVAILASLFPALRALRLDPAETLRSE
ncbi:MAG: ABC transporter permease [Acidobacteria bacterium]|nr:ABC transporter permease [Acidobacteriota bacterium]